MLDRVQFLLTLKMGMLTLIVWGDELNLALNWKIGKQDEYELYKVASIYIQLGTSQIISEI